MKFFDIFLKINERRIAINFYETKLLLPPRTGNLTGANKCKAISEFRNFDGTTYQCPAHYSERVPPLNNVENV